MYESQLLAKQIKDYAEIKKITLKSLFERCGMGRNSMAHLKGGKALAHDSLAKIADELDCSVDYLLGRTEDPLSHKANNIMDDVMVLDLEQRATPQIAPDAAKQHTKGNE